MNSNDSTWIVLEIVLVVSMLTLIFVVVGVDSGLRGELSRHREYAIHLGTNDKEIPAEKIREQMNEICAKYVDSYTVYVADNYSRGGDGNWMREVTLIYVFIDPPIDSIQKILDEALVKFNRSSIFFEENRGRSTLYSGLKRKK